MKLSMQERIISKSVSVRPKYSPLTQVPAGCDGRTSVIFARNGKLRTIEGDLIAGRKGTAVDLINKVAVGVAKAAVEVEIIGSRITLSTIVTYAAQYAIFDIDIVAGACKPATLR